MRKVICLITVFLLCLALACPAFAAGNEFVPSISYKDQPGVVPYPGGYPGILTNGDGEVIDYITDDCLVITPVGKAGEDQETLLDVYEKLKDGSMSIPYDDSIDPDNMVIRDLFDISLICGKYEVGPEQHIEMTFDLGVAPGVDVTAMVYADGEWHSAVNVVNNGDGTVTVTLDRLGTVAFSVPGSSIVVPAPGTGDADMGRVAFYGIVCAVSFVALIALLIFGVKRKRV